MADDAIEVEKNIRWETPVSDAKSLAMVSLLQENSKLDLKIILEDARDSERKRYAISFRNVPAYRNILETYCLSDLENSSVEKKAGWTREVLNSKWLEFFRVNEPFLHLNYDEIRHYRICTEDDIIDVITNKEPKVKFIVCAKENDPVPGQSTVYYSPDDRSEIDTLIKELQIGRHND